MGLTDSFGLVSFPAKAMKPDWLLAQGYLWNKNTPPPTHTHTHREVRISEWIDSIQNTISIL